jgi:hypothetical protein
MDTTDISLLRNKIKTHHPLMKKRLFFLQSYFTEKKALRLRPKLKFRFFSFLFLQFKKILYICTRYQKRYTLKQL